MDKMTKKERLEAALKGEEVDRIPISIWQHFSTVDQDPVSLAEIQVRTAEKFDYDFIKLMPFGLYGVQPWGAQIEIYCKINNPPNVVQYGIQKLSDWERLEVIPPYMGSYGKQVELARHVGRLTKGKGLPYIQTIFSPLTTARKLAGDRVFSDMRESPETVKTALQIITDTTIGFIKANLEAGVSGFFLATQCCNTDTISEEEYHEFEEPYMLQLLQSYQNETFLNIGHLHGENGMFALFSKLPFTVINWHDRWCAPSLSEARKITDKCLAGGIREVPYYDENGNKVRESLLKGNDVKEIQEHVWEAIREVNGRGLIIAPGCCVDQEVTETSQFALRSAVNISAWR